MPETHDEWICHAVVNAHFALGHDVWFLHRQILHCVPVDRWQTTFKATLYNSWNGQIQSATLDMYTMVTVHAPEIPGA